MKKLSLPALLAALALIGCTTGSAGRIATSPDAGARTCGLPAVAGESPVRRATRCAEAFIARNGYTDAAAAVDPARIASESIERTASLEERLARRHGQLRADAYGICVSGTDEHAFTVVFQYARGDAENGRGVTMSAAFDDLRVQHRDFILANVAERRHGCRPVSDGESSLVDGDGR